MNFIEAVEDWKSNGEWRYADKEAAWKFFFAAGKESSQAVISAQCVKMNQYESIIFELRQQLTKAEQRVAEWQPIDTAPKDGSWLLGWRQHAARPRLIQFDTDYEEWANEDGDHVYSTTHWMPLPTPPKRSMEGV